LEITQDFEQESKSSDIDQSFEVTSTGDNGSYCANVSGDGNTGNLQDTTAPSSSPLISRRSSRRTSAPIFRLVGTPR
jgi:hypothetical protein